MTLTLDRSVLAPALRLVSAVSAKGQAPITNHVLMRSAGDSVSLSCTDLDMWLSTVLQADGDIATCVPVDAVFRFVDSLPAGSQVGIDADDKQMTVRCGRSRASFGTLPADVFPMPTRESADGASVTLPAADLKRLFSRTVDAVASEVKGATFALSGLHLKGADRRLVAEAMDQKVMLRQALDCASDVPSTVLSPKTVRAIVRMLPADGDVSLTIDSRWISVSVGRTTLMSKLIDARYPSLDANVKAPCGTVVTMKTAALRSALDRMSMLATDNYKSVRLKIDGGVHMTARDGEDFVEAEVNGPAIDILMAVQSMTRLVAHIGGEDVKVGVIDGKRGLIVRDGAESGWVGAASALLG